MESVPPHQAIEMALRIDMGPACVASRRFPRVKAPLLVQILADHTVCLSVCPLLSSHTREDLSGCLLKCSMDTSQRTEKEALLSEAKEVVNKAEKPDVKLGLMQQIHTFESLST